jgi:hypothetical protein
MKKTLIEGGIWVAATAKRELEELRAKQNS